MTEYLRNFWERYGLILRVWAVFFVSIAALISLLALPQLSDFFNKELPAFNALIVGPLFGLLGTPVAVEGTMIRSTRFVAQIITACTPVFPSILYLAAVIAFPSRWREKVSRGRAPTAPSE